MSTDTDPNQLRRGVGVFGATLLGLGSILGTGVYFGIPELTAHAGTSLILPIVVAGLLAACNALSSAQLAARYPVSGGTYEYGYELLTPAAGFAAGWLFLCAKSASAATAALQVTNYVLDRPAPLPALGIVAVMTVLVISGLRRSTWMNTALVAITIIGLTTFVVAAMQSPTAATVASANTPSGLDTASFLELAALMFVGFTGYGRVATLGEEIRDPRRSIPIAVVTTLVASAVLYVVVAAGVNRFLPNISEGVTLTALVDSAGSPTRLIVSIGAVTAMLGVLLNLLLGLSRVVLAMARRHDLPHVFSRLNASRTTPVPAVLLVAGIVGTLVLLRDARSAWSLSAVTVLVYYSMTNLAALQLPPEHRLYPRWIAVLGLVGCLLLAVYVDRTSCLTGAAVLAAGLIGRAIIHRFRRAE